MGDVFLDTNVVVYAYDAAEPEKRRRALEVLAAHPDATLSTQVLLEWYSVVTRKFDPPLPTEEALAGLTALADLDVIGADAELVVRAARTAADHQLSIWDAMIIETAALAGCRTLLTEDLADGRRLRGVVVTNPFG